MSEHNKDGSFSLDSANPSTEQPPQGGLSDAATFRKKAEAIYLIDDGLLNSEAPAPVLAVAKELARQLRTNQIGQVVFAIEQHAIAIRGVLNEGSSIGSERVYELADLIEVLHAFCIIERRQNIA